MKKILNIVIVGALALIAMNSCKKNNVAVDKVIAAPDAAEFVSNTKNLAVSYFVRSDGTPFAIPIGLTNVSNVDRTVNFTYSSATAVAGTQYNAPASITIKAGEAVDTLRLSGIYAGYPLGRTDVLKVQITGATPTVFQRDSLVITLQRYCDVVLSNLSGSYANTQDDDGGGPYGPYTTTVTNLTSTGASTATVTINNFAFELWTPSPTLPIKVYLDWSDPSNFKASIPTQTIVSNYPPYGAVTITGAGVNTFSSCYNTFSFNYTMDVSVGSFGSFTTVLAR